MILLECPNCGPRNASEFRFGGEVQARPKPDQSDQRRWTAYLYLRRNSMGNQREWWYHRAGCGRWFIAERHTKTHAVSATYLWGET